MQGEDTHQAKQSNTQQPTTKHHQRNRTATNASRAEIERRTMKLNLVAIKGIASKLHSQMEPGYSSTFKNGTLPILSIAQIDKAVK